MLLILKPYYILDIGFMLSFLATLGIILYYGKMRRFLYKLPEALNKDLSLTLSAQCFSMPYAAFTLKNFSGGFIIGNLFLVPIYSVLVIMGNAALIVAFIRPVFMFICKIINLLIIASNGATYLLLKLSPPITYFTYLEAMALVAIYICFIFAKRGFKGAKYFPICIFILILVQNYYVFPEVSYVKLVNGSGIVVRYKSDSIIFTKFKLLSEEKDLIQSKLRISKFKDNCESIEGSFDNIKIVLNKDPTSTNYKLQLYDKKDKLLYIEDNCVYVKNIKDEYKYDIIKFKKEKKNNYELPEEEYSFKIIDHKIIVLK